MRFIHAPVRVALMVLLFAMLAAALDADSARAQATYPLNNSSFEGSTDGWVALPGGTLALDSAAPALSGASSGRLTSTAASTSPSPGSWRPRWPAPSPGPRPWCSTSTR